MRIPFLPLRALAAIAALAAVVGCEASNDSAHLIGVPSGLALGLLPGINPNNPPQATQEIFEVCKVGSSATFTVSSTSDPTAVSFSLDNGACRAVALYGAAGATVTVSETSAPSGFQLDHVDVQVISNGTFANYTQSGPTVTEKIGGVAADLRGVRAVYYNSEEPPPLVNGRMTGGGKQIVVGVATITRGFTVHCDITLSNNIEINWAGYRWHLDKPIDTAQCFDDPAINQQPPAAPLDKFVGTATGRLNGVDGSKLEFTFVDAGEPGRNDMAALKIWDSNGAVVLDVPLSLLNNGNIQAHFDQPHK